MLNRTGAFAVASLLVSACSDGPSTTGTTEAAETGATTGGGGPATATASTGQQGTLDSTTSGFPETTTTSPSNTSSSSSESTSGTQQEDPCPPGFGDDWPGRGAFLTLRTLEDFTEGPLALTCSIDRSLDPAELERGAVAALELDCDVPNENATSRLHVAVTLPQAVDGLEALVGLESVTVLFNYGTWHLKAPWTEAVHFAIRDESGPLFLSQWTNCEGQPTPPDNACSLFDPPADVDATWAAPLPEARLADVGCGTRLFEYNYPPAIDGPYDMGRLAVRFETDEGEVDVLDRHLQPLIIDGATYTFFATELLGEIHDPGVIGGQSGYTHFLRFFLLREP